MRNSAVLIRDLEYGTRVSMPAIYNATLMDMMHDAIRANAFRAIIAALEKDTQAQLETKAELEEYVQNIQSYLGRLKELPLDARTHELVLAADGNIQVYVNSARAVGTEASAGRVELALQKLPVLREKFELLEEDLGKLGERILAVTGEKSKESMDHAGNVQLLSVIILVFAAVGAGLLATNVIRSLNKSLEFISKGLSNESEKTVGVANELRDTAMALARSADEQASALQETAASIDEINAIAKSTTDNSQRLESAARLCLVAAEQGKDAVAHVLEAVVSIDEGNRNVTEQIDAGNREISGVITVISEIEAKTKVINDIVFQTKLLSFNASVEAARAGDNGKGFAVVAAEVGNLANMSGVAALEISELLAKSVSRVESIIRENQNRVESLVHEGHRRVEYGRKSVDECRDSLDEILKQTSTVTGMISEIARAVGEQGKGVEEINKAIKLLEKATQDNAEGARDTGDGSEQMQTQALSVQSHIRSLAKLTNGREN